MNRRNFIKNLFAAGVITILPNVELPKFPESPGMIIIDDPWAVSSTTILDDIMEMKRVIMESTGYAPNHIHFGSAFHDMFFSSDDVIKTLKKGGHYVELCEFER